MIGAFVVLLVLGAIGSCAGSKEDTKPFTATGDALVTEITKALSDGIKVNGLSLEAPKKSTYDVSYTATTYDDAWQPKDAWVVVTMDVPAGTSMDSAAVNGVAIADALAYLLKDNSSVEKLVFNGSMSGNEAYSALYQVIYTEPWPTAVGGFKSNLDMAASYSVKPWTNEGLSSSYKLDVLDKDAASSSQGAPEAQSIDAGVANPVDLQPVAAEAAPEVTLSMSQSNALSQAYNYLAMMHFSRDGLIQQLEYEGYPAEDATYAVENCGADWYAQALGKAQEYLQMTAFSYGGLIEQLEYEGFSNEEATYGVDNCGADWNEQAAKKAQDYISMMSFSRDGLIEQLQYEGFSYDEAAYGVTAVGY